VGWWVFHSSQALVAGVTTAPLLGMVGASSARHWRHWEFRMAPSGARIYLSEEGICTSSTALNANTLARTNTFARTVKRACCCRHGFREETALRPRA
jgi:hypothetical protein